MPLKSPCLFWSRVPKLPVFLYLRYLHLGHPFKAWNALGSHWCEIHTVSSHSGFLLAAREFISSVVISWTPTTRLGTALRFQPYLLLWTPQQLCTKPWNMWKTWFKRNSSHLTCSRSSLLLNFCLIFKPTTKVKSRGV